MDFWSREGRPKLIAALEAACDAVQDDFANAIQKHDDKRRESHSKELSQLKSAATRAELLEKENLELLREIRHLRNKHAAHEAKTASSFGPEHAPTTRPALAEVSTNSKILPLSTASSKLGSDEKPNWEKECLKLRKMNAALKERYQDTLRKGKEFREAREGWEKYAVSLEAKLKKLEKKLQRYEASGDQAPVPSTASKPAPARSANAEPLSGRTAIGSSFMSDPGSDTTHEGATTQPTGHRRASSTPAATLPQHADRAETEHEDQVDEETEDEAEAAHMLPRMPADMAAESAIAIKEEPSSDPVIISERCIRKRKYTDEDPGASEPSRRIKSEQGLSSDPVITAELPTFRPHESIDLDEDQDGVPTPKKQCLREDVAVSPTEDKAPLGLLHMNTRPGHDLIDTPTAGRAAPPESMHKSAKTNQSGRPLIRSDWGLGSAIADVAEDDFAQFHSPKPVRGGEALTHLTPTRGRLHSLLHHTSPEPSATVLRPTRQGQGSRNPHIDKQNEEHEPQGPGHHREVPTKGSPAVKFSSSTHPPKNPPEKSNIPKGSRLRDRPLADLRMEDFKVNTKYTGGYKHAFDEVVRNKDERAELAGCTDPNCCGKKFRAMAESELSAGGPGVLSRIADTKMMENYMGSEAHRLVEMTREERQELWLKAKTQDLADRYGRHRHRFTRRPSPPGYWNPDFPSTQEIEQRKEEGERMERMQVEERWREAMRGRRWVFRDE